jgi:hypothetical protein
MSRTRLAIALLAVTAPIAVAVTLGTGALSGAHRAGTGGSAPSCLPATLEHSAKLKGLPVDVSPAPDTGTANPRTQISFLGVPVTDIHAVWVVGQRSGHHSGRLQGYSQGDGASFVPERPFEAGERVTVRATIGAGEGAGGSAGKGAGGSAGKGAGGGSAGRGGGGEGAVVGAGTNAKRIAFGFRVDTPYPTAAVPAFPNPPAPPADYQSFATMPGVQVPVLSVTVPDRDPTAGDVLTTNGPGPGQYGPLIYTPQGRLVWFHRLSGGISAENLSVQRYEGQPHLTFWQGKVLALGFGQGEDVVMDSHYRTVARVVGGNGLRADLHDFQIAPRAVSYTTAFNAIRCDLSPVGGAREGAILDTAVQEIDMKSGLVRWEWHSLDHVGVAESQTAASTNPAPWDWFHVNSIDVEPGGNLFVSARSTWASYQLQGGSGDVLWRLGGSKSSFKMGPGTETAWQHDGRILPDGEVTLFDDGSNPPVHHQSRAVRIALDFKTHRALLRAAYVHPDRLLAVSQGNMQTLADGKAVVGYGSVPEIGEYARDGSLLFDAHLPLDMDSYRAYRFPWSGRPLTPPSVLANLNNTEEETIVHASWNGATGVSWWRVLAGERPQALGPQSTIPASVFEGSTVLPAKHAYVAVQALDSTGRVLGASQPVRVGSYAASFPTGGRPG